MTDERGFSMKWVIMGFKKYADFKTRSGRKEYWMFVLFQLIALSLAVSIDLIIGTQIWFVSFVYLLCTIIPTYAVTTRRFHDIGKSGLLIILAHAPYVGFLIGFLLCFKGTKGDNKYGPEPVY